MTARNPSTVASRASRMQTNAGVALQVRRALLIAGIVGLIGGVIVGILEANPGVLIAWLQTDVQPTSVALIGIAVIGLLCGALAGMNLRERTFLLNLLAALVAMLAGWLASVLSQGIMMGLLLHDSLVRGGDALPLAQLGLGFFGALGGLLAVHLIHVRPGPRAAPPARPEAPAQAEPQAPPARRARRASAQAADARNVNASNSGAASGTRAPTRQRRSAVAASANSGPASASAQRPLKINRPAPKRQGRRLLPWKQHKTVHLHKDVVEVCPYCFEEVKPHDPRGRVVCKICGTAHHGDCWAVAGRCQVPHLQT